MHPLATNLKVRHFHSHFIAEEIEVQGSKRIVEEGVEVGFEPRSD